MFTSDREGWGAEGGPDEAVELGNMSVLRCREDTSPSNPELCGARSAMDFRLLRGSLMLSPD